MEEEYADLFFILFYFFKHLGKVPLSHWCSVIETCPGSPSSWSSSSYCPAPVWSAGICTVCLTSGRKSCRAPVENPGLWPSLFPSGQTQRMPEGKWEWREGDQLTEKNFDGGGKEMCGGTRARAARGLRLSKDSSRCAAPGDEGGKSRFSSASCPNADRKSK